MTNTQYRLPWGMTAKEARESYREYQANGGELGFRAWLRKHRFLEIVCNSSASSFTYIRRLSDELFV